MPILDFGKQRYILKDAEVASVNGAINLLPTLADLAGLKAEISKPMDDRSFAGVLTGEQAELPDRPIFRFVINRSA
ncbi:MAG: hypothetical protein P1V20_08810 [Verrucomicrobiales bacterium]|nr:hypothetical protein [Verrucomicrobiales bacterium]